MKHFDLFECFSIKHVGLSRLEMKAYDFLQTVITQTQLTCFSRYSILVNICYFKSEYLEHFSFMDCK